MAEFNYGDIIEYKDETYDPNFEEARNWAKEHNTTFDELVDRREEREEEDPNAITEESNDEEIDGEQAEEKKTITVLYRYFQIGPEHIVTHEEQRQKRAEAYRSEKDPITCQIESLRDEEQTPEVIEEIEQLKQERAAVVESIHERYPYPDES